MSSLRAIFWYLSGLFLFGLLTTSVMSVAPGSERFQLKLMVVEGGSAVLFAVLASIYRNAGPKQLGGLLKVFQGIAIVATLLVLFVSVG